MGVECFLVEQGQEAERSLRRYAKDSHGQCPSHGYHHAVVKLGRHALVVEPDGSIAWLDPVTYLTHPGWPTNCACGYVFTEDDMRQVNQDPIYVAVDGRGEWTLREIPAGAIWVAQWLGEHWQINGGAGPAYVIKLPNGSEFIPGSRANNCTRPDEDHDCWCVHGEAPGLTINKTPEPGRSTCDAGGGSIWSGQGTDNEWHGFVTNGELVG